MLPWWFYKRLFISTLPYMSRKDSLFRKTKNVFLQEICLSTLKSDAFPPTKSFSFTQAFLHYYPKQPFSTLHFPFAPSYNLLSTKEHGHSFVVRSKSSRCNAETSHRFKAFSPPFCEKSRVRHVPSEASSKIFPAEL